MQTLHKLDSLLAKLTTEVPKVEPRLHLTPSRPLECSYRQLDTLMAILLQYYVCIYLHYLCSDFLVINLESHLSQRHVIIVFKHVLLIFHFLL